MVHRPLSRGSDCNAFWDLFIITASETAYDPQLFDDDVFWERELDTQSEDLWDALVLKKSERRVYLKRFGAGEDRIVHY